MCSNNKGKIVGKWKATSWPGMDEKDKQVMQKLGGEEGFSIVIEFTDAGKMIGILNMNILGQTKTQEVMTADYKLGTGDWIFFTNMKPPAKDGKTESKDKIVISGDTMTIDTEKGDKVTLTRMK
ncbi:MAG: hypothetical protein L0241_09820 [Planctomycetia bacterium]|nr:hypothetical protein [Planctomycetia bacterium]